MHLQGTGSARKRGWDPKDITISKSARLIVITFGLFNISQIQKATVHTELGAIPSDTGI
jgi:hypothetical protein